MQRHEIVKGQPAWKWVDLFHWHYEFRQSGYEMICFPSDGNALEQPHLIMILFDIIKSEEHRIIKAKR